MTPLIVPHTVQSAHHSPAAAGAGGLPTNVAKVGFYQKWVESVTLQSFSSMEWYLEAKEETSSKIVFSTSIEC